MLRLLLVLSLARVLSASAGTGPLKPGALLEDLPIHFEVNAGQAEPGVEFLARREGFSLQLGRVGVEMAFGGDEQLRMRFLGSRDRLAWEPLDPLEGWVSYFVGSEPARWQSGVRTFAKVRCRRVYPGIDVVLYGNGGGLEYDWLVEPGAEPALIRLGFEGAERLSLAANGDLVARLGVHEVRHRRPVAYQETATGRRPVEVRFVLEGVTARFLVGGYDRSLPLVIDPYLVYSKNFGGWHMPGYTLGYYLAGGGRGRAIAVDPQGYAYVTGRSSDKGAFVCKLSPDGSRFIYELYLGSGEGRAITLDAEGNAYVTGYAASDFPAVGAFQPGRRAPGVFVAKINPEGTKLVYSFTLGGGILVPVDPGPSVIYLSKDDAEPAVGTGLGIALDAKGFVYVAGFAIGPLPTTPGALQPSQPKQCPERGPQVCVDGFVVKLDPAASTLVYATYLGGSSRDEVRSIAVDAAGNAYVAGFTQSDDFPVTPGAFQPKRARPTDWPNAPAEAHSDAFVTQIAPDGKTLAYSTYLGGRYHDEARGIALDGKGRVFVTGVTGSEDFPEVPAIPGVGLGTSTRPFIAKLSLPDYATAYSLLGRYLIPGSPGVGWVGWTGVATAIAIDPDGNPVVTGYPGLFKPTEDALQPTAINPYNVGCFEGFRPDLRTQYWAFRSCTQQFVLKVGGEVPAPVFATELATYGFARGDGIAVDPAGNIYATGTGKVAPVGSSVPSGSAFVAKISPGGVPPVFTKESIVNAASYQSGLPPAGALATIFGKNLTNAEGVLTAAGYPLPYELGGTRVYVSGVPAPLLAVANVGGREQVNFQVPGLPRSEHWIPGVAVSRDGINGYVVYLTSCQAGLFTSAQGYGAIQHADGSLVTPDKPAEKGEVIVIYGTALGFVEMGRVEIGMPSPSSPPVELNTKPRVLFGAVPAEVLFAGLTPGLAGVGQLNVRVPANSPTGDVEIAMEVAPYQSWARVKTRVR